MIAESVPDHVFNWIKTKTTTMELWDALKGLCQSRFKLIIIDLNKRVQNAKCGEDDDIRAHINKLDDMREQLSAMGKVIDDQEYASILLGSLPTSYAPTISLINTMAVMTGLDITPDRVARLATNEFDQRMIAAGKFNNGPDEAFATEDQKKDRSNFECYNCHKKGHVKSKCCAKGGGKEGQRPPRNNNRMSKSNRNNRKSNVNQNNDNANSANADTEAWAAIEEIEETEAAVEDQMSQGCSRKIKYRHSISVPLLQISGIE